VLWNWAENLALELAHFKRVKAARADTCDFRHSSVLIIFPKVQKEDTMAWTTPVLVEICVGLEINGYMPADGYVPPEY
jgi:coenzyme PQQ precursor peptide PqqA